MSHHDPDDEDWYDEEDDDLDEEVAARCPECGAAICEDLDHCTKCGYWLTDADFRAADHDTHPSRRVRLVAVVMIVVFLMTLLLAGTIF
jgi:hypothetical protein